MEVEVISRETIKPSSPTPSHLRTFKLSLLDQLAPVSYVPVTCYYPLSDDDHKNIKQILIRLKESLSETLSRFYPLAGRIKDSLFIDCNDEGVMFSEANVDCDLSEFLKHPNIDSIEQFLPCQLVPTEPATTVVQVATQANVFASGGFALTVCFLHKIVDGTTIGAFLKCWGAIGRGSYDNAFCPDCTAASQLFPPTESLQDGMSLLIEGRMLKEGKGVKRRFVFNAEAISALKKKAASQSVPNPSRVEVVSAFIWKCAMAASRVVSGSEQPSILTHSVNMRRRAEPPISAHSIGNIFWKAIASHKPSPGQETELHVLVSLLRESVAKINDNYIRKLQGDEGILTASGFLAEVNQVFSKEKQNLYMFISWSKAGYNEFDFGLGKPIWVSYLGGIVHPFYIDAVCLIDTPCGEGIEAWVLLGEKEMAILESDPEFIALASLNPSIDLPVDF